MQSYNTFWAMTITSPVKTRFAPSPTGFMHIGNARTALFSYLFAKNQQGKFLLRVEDTDQERSKPEYISALLEDLAKLGLHWDEEVIYQSKRAAIYEQYYQQLFKKNLIYRCFCSEEKLNIMRKIQLSQGLPPRYAGTCLNLTANEIEKKLADNESACWRFKVPKDTVIEFDDLVKGKQTFNSRDFGDFVIKRQDGTPSFMFCSVIDDVLQSVTHVLRAEDHVSNTPRQLLILDAIGMQAPTYGHFCLLINGEEAGSAKLSKRQGGQSIQQLFQDGYLPQALLNYLARLGHGYISKENQLFSLEELAINFNFKNTTSSAAKHDLAHLKFWQKQAMLVISNQELLMILKKYADFLAIQNSNKFSDKIQEFLNLIKSNILMPSEAILWSKILFDDDYYFCQDLLKNIDLNFLAKFLEIIAVHQDFNSLCNHLKTAGFAGKNLFINLRLIFTGQTSGPELNKIFEIMGATRIQYRAEKILKK